jgi:hypothetical protein
MGYEKKTVKVAKDEGPDQWELESDLQALARAHAIKKDPDRMKKVKDFAATKAKESQKQKDEAQHKLNLGKDNG